MLNKNILILILILFLTGFLLGACTPAGISEPSSPTISPPTSTPVPEPIAPPEPEPILLADGLGNEITLDEPAQSIISLAPSNTELLFAVSAGAQVVGRDAFSDFPTEALEIADIGGGFGDMDTETVLALEPDLVLAADITPPEHIQTLMDLGLQVFTLSNPTDLEGVYENLRVVAKLTGHESKAEELIEDLIARVDAIEALIKTVETRPLVFYQLDSTDPAAPWTAGPGNFIDSLITMSGGTNLGSNLDSPWVQISAEELIAQNPDIIIVGDFTWGGVTVEDVVGRPGWDVIAAVQNEQVYTFDDNLVSRPGPRMVDGLEAMTKLLHPELFE